MEHKNTRFCVTDGLRRQEKDREGIAGIGQMECSSPRRIIGRFLRRMTVRKKVANRVATATATATPSGRGRETGIEDKVVPGNKKVENVVACSLFYLTMVSRNELEKMKELQRDTRVILGEIKEEMRRKNRDQEPYEAVESPTSCLTDGGPLFHCRRLRTPFVGGGGDRSGDSSQSKQEGGHERDRLEVELEAELERLQLHLDSESSSKQGCHPHAATTRIADHAHSRMRDGEGHSDLQGAVDAVKLERKLHELLESRQEEQIKELEDAVVYYKSELCKKEKEITWWRNTAMLLSQRANEAKLMIWPE